ncbi:MAG: hypothetical protein GC184_06155 [Rhizobiales bacterium]|nr:hypothetical protein [Hyphomicrobiales bacterium]
MANSGKASEEFFEDHWRDRGKATFIYRFPDTGDILKRIRTMIGKVASGTRLAEIIGPQPADYLIVDHEFGTFFAEVKSCSTKKSFPFSNITPSQWSTSKRCEAARGNYYFFIHNVTTDHWYRVPSSVINNAQASSFAWSDLEENFRWK